MVLVCVVLYLILWIKCNLTIWTHHILIAECWTKSWQLSDEFLPCSYDASGTQWVSQC